MTSPARLPAPPQETADDYLLVRDSLRYLTENYRDQPDLAALGRAIGADPALLHRTFVRWAGLTPKAFLQAVTLDAARRMLDDEQSVLDTALDVGLSGPGRLHDLFVTHEAMSPGAYKARGAGLTIRWGWHPSPFGRALIMVTERGLAGIGFADEGGEAAGFADMARRWPAARYAEDREATAAVAGRVFDPARWRADEPLKVVLIGSDFELRVWEQLLTIPIGRATTYSGIAGRLGQPSAARAVGGAVGRNPISFVVPCHRVIGRDGALTGYHWGLTRKKAILGWECGLSTRP